MISNHTWSQARPLHGLDGTLEDSIVGYKQVVLVASWRLQRLLWSVQAWDLLGEAVDVAPSNHQIPCLHTHHLPTRPLEQVL